MDRSRDPRIDVTRRHHVLESGLQKAVKVAVNKAGITKRVSCHTFAGKRCQHPDGSGAYGPCRRQNHRDLHACHGKGYFRCFKPDRSSAQS